MTIIVSKCLLGVNCKYNGGHNYCKEVVDYLKDKDYIALCPEQLGGLETPRIPCERLGTLVINQHGEDKTAYFKKGVEKCLSQIEGKSIEKAILKAKSPSCGKGMIYNGHFENQLVPGNGLFTEALLERKINVYTEKEDFINGGKNMSDIYQEALELHKKAKGKLAVEAKVSLDKREDLSLAYTPGVAEPCRKIAKNPDDVYKYTWKSNSVAVVTDGTAVLGLGDIGPAAALPVMEGKSILFKKFGGVDAVPVCLDTKDSQEIIRIVKAIAPTYGGINLEDISAPRCVEIERTLIEELDIPVFHDDQHGTAIVVTAGLINALKLVGKEAKDITVVVSGTGAAGSSIIKMIKQLGVKEIYGFNINGIVIKEDQENYDFLTRELADITNSQNKRMDLAAALEEADVFIGVSAPGIVTKEMASKMKKDAIMFAMANPEPEITYDKAKAAGVRVMGTGRSDFPNQINNVLAFPGLFRGALDVRAKKINEEMKLAAAYGLASLVSDEELCETYIIPSAMDERVAKVVAEAVAKAAIETGVARLNDK